MPYNPGIQARPFHADMSGWGRALMSMLGDQKAERTERDSLIERYGGKAGQEGVPSAPIYGQIGGDYGSMEGPYEGTGEGGATDEMKAQAKSAKAFRDLGEHLYGYSREELSTKSLGELRGLARKEESAIVQQEKTQARQDRLAQFAEVQKQHQIVNDQNWARDMSAAGQQVSENIRRMGQDNRADAQAKLAAQIHADTVARFGRVEAERGADRNAYRSMLQFGQPMQPGEEGPMPSMQFNAARAMQQTGGNIQPEDIAALEKMGRSSRVGTMTDIAGDPSGKFLWQADNAGYRVPTGQGGTGAAKPTITITEKNGDRTVTRKVTEEQFAALPQPVQRDAIVDGQIAELEAMEKRGAKKAELTDNGVSQPMFGGKPIGDLLAQLRARRGGGAAASGPASGGSRFKVEEIK